MNINKNLVLEINTKSGSNYKLYSYSGEDGILNVLSSSSNSFDNANFIKVSSIKIDDKLGFEGSAYFNALIELYDKKYRVVSKNKKKDVVFAKLEEIQYTTNIKDIVIHNKKIFDELINNKTISIDQKYIEKYEI